MIICILTVKRTGDREDEVEETVRGRKFRVTGKGDEDKERICQDDLFFEVFV